MPKLVMKVNAIIKGDVRSMTNECPPSLIPTLMRSEILAMNKKTAVHMKRWGTKSDGFLFLIALTITKKIAPKTRQQTGMR